MKKSNISPLDIHSCDDIDKLSKEEKEELLLSCEMLLEDHRSPLDENEYEHTYRIRDLVYECTGNTSDLDYQLRRCRNLADTILYADPDEDNHQVLQQLMDKIIENLAQISDVNVGLRFKYCLEEISPEFDDVSPFEIEWLAINQYPNTDNISKEDIHLAEQTLGRKLTADDYETIKSIQRKITQNLGSE